jgi:hypothetical protein
MITNARIAPPSRAHGRAIHGLGRQSTSKAPVAAGMGFTPLFAA